MEKENSKIQMDAGRITINNSTNSMGDGNFSKASFNFPVILQESHCFNKTRTQAFPEIIDVCSPFKPSPPALKEALLNERTKANLKKTILETVKGAKRLFPRGMLWRDVLQLLKESYKIPDSLEFRIIMEIALTQLVKEGSLEKKNAYYSYTFKENLKSHEKLVTKPNVNSKSYSPTIQNGRKLFLPEIRQVCEVTPRPHTPELKYENRDAEIRRMVLSRPAQPRARLGFITSNGHRIAIPVFLNENEETEHEEVNSQFEPDSQIQRQRGRSPTNRVEQDHEPGQSSSPTPTMGPIITREFYTVVDSPGQSEQERLTGDDADESEGEDGPHGHVNFDGIYGVFHPA